MLIQVIYCSAASHFVSRADLADILEISRRNNLEKGITGMLLYSEGSFFQVLEGEDECIDALLSKLEQDPRHQRVTIIIREPIAERSFCDWAMGYADISPIETLEISETSELAQVSKPLAEIPEGRARKLLEAFQKGRWRRRVSDNFLPDGSCSLQTKALKTEIFSPPVGIPAPEKREYSFAFQPIVDARQKRVFSYEALLRGPDQQSAKHVLDGVPPEALVDLDSQSRLYALQMAAHLGLTAHLNLNMIPSSALNRPSAIPDVLNMAERCGLRPEQVVLEVLESEVIEDLVLRSTISGPGTPGSTCSPNSNRTSSSST